MQVISVMKSKSMPFLAALFLAIASMGIATVASQPGSLLGPEAANAAVYGQPGCLPGTAKFVYGKPSRWGVPIMYEVCTYRTSMGSLIYNYKLGAWYPLHRSWWYA